jgi:AhpD family alkylhydroperoxidase
MTPRLSYDKLAPDALKSLLSLERYLHHGGDIEPMLMHLVKLRASQINGCAYCIDMHAKDLLAGGETMQRIYGLDAWRESPYYTDRERAALEWTEAVTLISQTHAEDEIFQRIKPHFSDKELADLTWIIAGINAWNRLAISMRTPPGTYQPPKAATPARVTA